MLRGKMEIVGCTPTLLLRLNLAMVGYFYNIQKYTSVSYQYIDISHLNFV